jgi:UDP-N-acetyl-D-glucosamine dehydrogenase
MDSVADMMKAVREADAVVIVTDHKVYDYAAIIENAKFIFDSRNASGKVARKHEKVERL